jgi:phosphoribosylanthranilate isomerase
VSRTRVKICGLTSAKDALQAVALGADAIGLVFYSGSARAVDIEAAAQIRSALPAFISVVGLFVNPSTAEVEHVLRHVRIDCLQFHGDEADVFCTSFGIPYMKAIRVRPEMDLILEIANYSKSSAILLDNYDKNSPGGTGQSFDWNVARDCVQNSAAKIVLAGGLRAENVASAIREVQPYAVDVSSGVESAPGRKCNDRMKAFFQEVYSV